MAAYTRMIQESQSRRRKLAESIQSHRRSIVELEREVKQLDAVIASLEKLSKAPTGPGRKVRAAKSTTRRRGTWKPGKPGRPPRWYQEKQKAKTKAKTKARAKAKTRTRAKAKPAPATARKTAPKKRKPTPKQLAALARARAAAKAARNARKAAGK